MFLAPVLFLVHALLMAVSLIICAILPVRAGFNVSGGFIDWVLSAKVPMAQNSWMIIPIGIVFFCIYYSLFRFIIIKFDLKTPGREDFKAYENEKRIKLDINDFPQMAKAILKGLGGAENILSVDNCITRLRAEVKHHEDVSEKKIKMAGATGVIRPSRNSVQVIVGTNVQFVTDELKKLIDRRG
jgi:PTS system N-acetylglucosamine-specific IIC component